MPKTVKSPRRLGVAVPDPVDVPKLAGAVQGLALVKVNSVARGVHLHSIFVVSTEGLPLGVLNAQFSAPQPKSDTDT